MKPKNIIIVLLVALAISAAVLFFMKKAVAKQANVTSTALANVQPENTVFPLRYGSTGKAVKLAQGALGVTVDGIFGSQTQGAAINAGSEDGSIGKDWFINTWFTSVMRDEANLFPLTQGSNSSAVYCMAIMLDVDPNNADAIFKAAQTAFGKTSFTIQDYKNLAKKVFGFTDADLA